MEHYKDVETMAKELVGACTPSKRADASFMYFGDLPIGETYGYAFGVHRDSDIMERSNWRVITKDLLDRFPEDCEIESASHWAVGWTDSLACRLLDDEGKPTELASAVYEWREALANYPLADELDYSELECEEAMESWDNYGRRDFTNAIHKQYDIDVSECSDDAIDKLFYDPDTDRSWETHSDGIYFDIDGAVESIEIETLLAMEGSIDERTVELPIRLVGYHALKYSEKHGVPLYIMGPSEYPERITVEKADKLFASQLALCYCDPVDFHGDTSIVL